MKYLGAPLAWIVAIVMAFLFLGQCRRGAPAIPPELKARADSLEATKAKADSALAANARLTDSVAVLATRLRASTRPARATAEATGITADSAAILAQRATSAADSALAWQAAYNARTAQTVAQASVIARLDSAAVQDSIGRAVISRSLAETSARLLVAEGLVTDLVEAAEKKHRWRWLERFNVTAGYGATASVGGQFTHGLSVVAGWTIYP